VKRQQALVAARLNWWGLMKRAWPNDPDVEERVRFYTDLYAELVAMDQRKLEELVKEKYPLVVGGVRNGMTHASVTETTP
jgi:hypothetical protein